MKTIAFSLTCHENIDCVLDLLNNIYYYSTDFNIIILISTNKHINEEIKKCNVPENVIIVNVRENEFNIYKNIYLFYEHILNIKYLLNNDIKFDYFWFVSSNEYFIKKITEDFLQKNIVKIRGVRNKLSDSFMDEYYKEFTSETKYDWYWFNEIKKDTYFIDVLRKNKILIRNMSCDHEGLVLTKELTYEIMSSYLHYNINENSTNPNYTMEEIFIKSYLNSKYFITKINVFCSKNLQSLLDSIKGNEKEENYEKIFKELYDDEYCISVKPVTRIYDYSFREFLRNKMI
jgi:hypothetical protein